MVFETASRTYVVVLDSDLFGNWSVKRSWGGKNDHLNGGRVTVVESFEAGLALLERIARTKCKHQYRCVSASTA